LGENAFSSVEKTSKPKEKTRLLGVSHFSYFRMSFLAPAKYAYRAAGCHHLCPERPSTPHCLFENIPQRKFQHSFFAHIKKKNYLCRKLAGMGSCPIVYSPIQTAQSTDFQRHLSQKKVPATQLLQQHNNHQ